MTKATWRSPRAAREPAKGMMNSLGIGVRIPSTSMRRKIPGYPIAATMAMTHSVSHRKRDAIGFAATTGVRVSRFRGGYHAPEALRGRLSVLHDGLPAEQHGLREAGLHPFEGGPAARVLDALRGEPVVRSEERRVGKECRS